MSEVIPAEAVVPAPEAFVRGVGTAALVSVITPLFKPDMGHLREGYDSLCAQELPEGWGFEWILGGAGRTGELSDLFPEDQRVRKSPTLPGETASVRTISLAVSRGCLIKTFDQDDLLPDEQALARDIKAFQQNPGVQWVCSRAVDLYPDGSTYAPEDEMPPGIVERDVVFNKWVELGHTPPIHPASSCYRRNAIVQLGGWMALRHAGDTGLLLAANTLWQGYYIDTPGLLWRRHAAQTSSQSVHNDTDERSLRNEVMTERVAALRASRPA